MALVLSLIADQISKALIAEIQGYVRFTLIPGVLWIVKATNTGMAFGMFSAHTDVISLASIFIVIIMTFFALKIPKERKLLRISLGLIIGGALGNIVDRLRFGMVLDFIQLAYFPAIFNLADTFIVIGGTLIALDLIRRERHGVHRHREGKRLALGQVLERQAAELDITFYDPESHQRWQGVGGWLDQKAGLQGESGREN